jgi:hypothetical protein
MALEIFDAILKTTPENSMQFKEPPYEYEYKLMPFDILSGDSGMRISLLENQPVEYEKQRWREEIEAFRKEFAGLAVYHD